MARAAGLLPVPSLALAALTVRAPLQIRRLRVPAFRKVLPFFALLVWQSGKLLPTNRPGLPIRADAACAGPYPWWLPAIEAPPRHDAKAAGSACELLQELPARRWPPTGRRNRSASPAGRPSLPLWPTKVLLVVSLARRELAVEQPPPHWAHQYNRGPRKDVGLMRATSPSAWRQPPGPARPDLGWRGRLVRKPRAHPRRSPSRNPCQAAAVRMVSFPHPPAPSILVITHQRWPALEPRS